MPNKFCPLCGKENVDNSNFCAFCGADLRGDGASVNPQPQPQPQPQQQVQLQPGEYAEPLVELKTRSFAPFIVSAAITYTFIIPMIFFPFYIGNLSIEFYQTYIWFAIFFSVFLAAVIEPLSLVFGIINTVNYNRLGGQWVSYVPSRNTFIFPIRGGIREIYARDIVGISGPAAVVVSYYENGTRVRFASGWCVRDDIYLLQDKLTEVLATSVI